MMKSANSIIAAIALLAIALASFGTVRAYINGDYDQGFSHEQKDEQ